jgi:hypothetical protein
VERAAGGVEANHDETVMTNEELLRERVAKLEVQVTGKNINAVSTHSSHKPHDHHKSPQPHHDAFLAGASNISSSNGRQVLRSLLSARTHPRKFDWRHGR